MIKLQSGVFDNPNRLFYSVSKEWRSVLENAGNVRELIPEFFMNDSSFLINTLGLSLGIRANKKPVNVCFYFFYRMLNFLNGQKALMIS